MAFSNGYSYRRLITVDHTKVGGTISGFKVLFAGTYSYLADTGNGGLVHNNTYPDIRFEDTLGNKLSHELARWDNTTGYIAAWVEVNVNSSSDAQVYVYYGKDISSSEESATSIWGGYRGVWHLSTANDIKDSSANGYNGTLTGSLPTTTSNTSPFGYSLDFDGTSYITLPSNPTLQGNFPVGFSAWMRPDFTGSNGASIFRTDYWTPTHYSGWGGNIDTSNSRVEFSYGVGSSGGGPSSRKSFYPPSGSTPDATWVHIVGVATSSTSIQLYINGSGVSITSTGTATSMGWGYGTPYIAANGSTTFKGKIAEVRTFGSDPGSAEWTTEYKNQSSPSTFYSVGSEQSAQIATATVSGDSTVAGTAILKLTALSTVSGDAIASSSITRMLFLEASESGDSSALSDIIDMGGDPTASVLGDSIASLTAIAEILFSGSSSGDSTVDADIVLLEELEASISGGSTVSSGATVIFAVISSVYGDSTVVAYTYVGPFLPPSYTPGGDIGFEGRVTPTGTLLVGSDGLSGGLEARIKGSVDMQAAEEVEVGSFELP